MKLDSEERENSGSGTEHNLAFEKLGIKKSKIRIRLKNELKQTND